MTDDQEAPALVPAPLTQPPEQTVVGSAVTPRQTGGEWVGSRISPIVDKFGPITVYAVTAAIGVGAAVASGALAIALLILAAVVGTLGAIYNQRESNNYTALTQELHAAAAAQTAAERSEKHARERELEIRSRATVLAIKAFMGDLGLTAHDRATLFWVRPDRPPRLFVIERLAQNPVYGRYEEAKFYEADEGFIGRALNDGHVYCPNLPDPQEDGAAYASAHVGHGLTSRQVDDLSMQSRTYFGLAIESVTEGQGFVGVLMLESLDANRWDDRMADVGSLRARLRVSLGYLILEGMPAGDESGEEAQELYP